MEKDPYKILGVPTSATNDDIHKAFRVLASKYHPDRNLDDQENASIKFKEISSAFEILGDEVRRRQYDLYREGSFSTFSFRSRNPVDDIFDNMFSRFFGDQRPSGSRIRVKITLEEAYFGCSKKVEVENHEFCEECKGTGSSSWQTCVKCGGKGFFSFSNGEMSSRSSCSKCEGRGSLPKDKCKSCSGLAYSVSGSKQIDVQIPPGIESGSQIRLSGEGHDGSDLFITVSIERHVLFERQNSLLTSKIYSSYYKLVLGGIEEFDFFGSKVSVKIPPRTRPGTKLKIKGKGMPTPQNPSVKGDMIMEICLKMPSVLTKEHENALVLLSKIDSSN